ncbi:MAG: type II toxin-antitoxin system HicB family antitoxin [Bryobacteraceae bacterium]|nr:type II toxin-antitoxin system HicB family antitoxin [Bryobacteraceae bacterium]
MSGRRQTGPPYVLDLQDGMAATGKTLEEAKRSIREVIEGHPENLRQFGDPIPEASSMAGEVEITSGT